MIFSQNFEDPGKHLDTQDPHDVSREFYFHEVKIIFTHVMHVYIELAFYLVLFNGFDLYCLRRFIMWRPSWCSKFVIGATFIFAIGCAIQLYRNQ